MPDATATMKNDKAVGRVLLPKHATPTKYDVQIKPDMVNHTFDGFVKITMRTTTAENMPIGDGKKRIVLHAKELLFSKAEYKVIGAEGLLQEKSKAESPPDSGLVEAQQVGLFPERLHV